MKNTLTITTLGCLLAAILLVGCKKDDALQSAAREASANHEAKVENSAAVRPGLSEEARKSLAECDALITEAAKRRGSDAEVEAIAASDLCNPKR